MPGRVRRLRQRNRSLRQQLQKAGRMAERQYEQQEAITAPLTKKRLRTEMNAATRLRYRPEQQEIEGQQRTSDVQQTNITNWYGEYQRRVAESNARQQAAQREAQAAITGMQTSAQTADDAARGQAQQTAQTDAAARGVQAGTEPFKADLDAAAARRASTSSFGSMLATQGAARDTYMADKGRIGAGDEVQQHLQEATRRRGLDKDMRELQADKGAFRTQYKADARESERKNNLTLAAFGLDQDKAAADVQLKRAAQQSLDSDRTTDNRRQRRQDRIDKRENDRGYQLDLDKFGAATAKDNYQRKHGLGPYKPSADTDKDGKPKLTPAQIRARRKDSETAFSKVQTGVSDMGAYGKTEVEDSEGKKRLPTREEVFARMRKEGYSQDEITVALAIRHGKKTWNTWDARTKAAAKRLGIRPRSAGGANESPNLGDLRGENAKG